MFKSFAEHSECLTFRLKDGISKMDNIVSFGIFNANDIHNALCVTTSDEGYLLCLTNDESSKPSIFVKGGVLQENVPGQKIFTVTDDSAAKATDSVANEGADEHSSDSNGQNANVRSSVKPHSVTINRHPDYMIFQSSDPGPIKYYKMHCMHHTFH